MKLRLFLGLILLSGPLLHAETDPLKKVAAELAAGIRKKGPVKVAVLALPQHNDRESDGPYIVSERLTGYLSAEMKTAVVERQHIVEALNELHLSETGVLDPNTTKMIGQSLGADVIVTGTLINLPKQKCEVNARALMSNSGRIIAASRAIVDRNWEIKKSLDLSQQLIASVSASDELRSISKKITAALRASKTSLSLAVLTFPYSRNRMCTGSHLVSERLVTYLVQDGRTLIERRLLQKILEERKLWETGIADASALKNIQPIMGVDAIVTGSLSDPTEFTTEVLARVIKIDTGEILAAASAIIDRIWNDTPKLPRIAQPRSAVPMATLPVESLQQPVKSPTRGGLTTNVMSLGPRRVGERQRYYPAPIPFVMPVTPMKTQGEKPREEKIPVIPPYNSHLLLQR